MTSRLRLGLAWVCLVAAFGTAACKLKTPSKRTSRPATELGGDVRGHVDSASEPGAASASSPASSAGRSPSTPSAPPPPATPAVITFGGKPFVVKGALATHSGGRGFEIHVANLPLVCSDVTSNGYSPRPGEERFTLEFGQVVTGTGTTEWHVVGVGYSAFHGESDYGAAIVSGSTPIVGSSISARVRVASTPQGFKQDPPPELFVEGLLEAKGCGEKRIHDAPKRPQADVRVTFGGLAIPITGAILEHDGDKRVLWFQNAPIDCDGNVPHGDLAIRMFIDADGVVDHVHLMGDSLLAQTTLGGLRIDTSQSARVELGPADPSGALPAKVNATLRVNDVGLSIDGRVTALDCPQPEPQR
ncbi:MAG: hypothetical protein U0271_15085 [Polyangiaceae bacterium]